MGAVITWLFSGSVLAFGALAVANVTGFCMTELRWPSAKQRLETAHTYSAPLGCRNGIVPDDVCGRGKRAIARWMIKHHPDCCGIYRSLPRSFSTAINDEIGYPNITLFDRALGRGYGYYVYPFSSLVLADEPISVSQPDIDGPDAKTSTVRFNPTLRIVSNCGTPRFGTL